MEFHRYLRAMRVCLMRTWEGKGGNTVIRYALPSVRCVGVFCAVLILMADCLLAQEARQDPPSVERILAAWGRRRDAIKTLHYEGDLELAYMAASRPGDADLFNDAPPDKPAMEVVLRQTISFSAAGTMVDFRLKGEQWEPMQCVRKPYFYRATFDGTTYRTLMKMSDIPMGTSDETAGAGDEVTLVFDQTAFWLAFDPCRHFDQFGYDTKRMVIRNGMATSDAYPSVDVVMPGSVPQAVVLLCLDTSKDYLPVRFVREIDGMPRSQFDIEYAKNHVVGWVVSSWTSQVMGRTSRVKIRKCSVNGDLDGELFTLEFPAGTHVIEQTAQGEQYYIQLADGAQIPIARDQYGQPPEPSPPGPQAK
jgi:hypothetical protein